MTTTIDLCTHEDEETVCEIAHGFLNDYQRGSLLTICCGCGTVLEVIPPKNCRSCTALLPLSDPDVCERCDEHRGEA